MAAKIRKAKRAVSPANQLESARTPAGVEATGGILLEFRHGLGDLVQLSIVLRHLNAVNPGAAIDVVCADDKVLSCSGFERQRFGFHNPRYHQGGWDQVYNLDFPDCMDDVHGFPMTKPYTMLSQILRIAPVPELFRYAMVIGKDASQRAADYLQKICGGQRRNDGKFPVVIFHYIGCSSRMQKDLPNEVVALAVNAARLRGRAVAIFDNERLSPLVDQATVFAPLNGNPCWGNVGSADPETMAAMIDQAELFVGIDSGPLHIAGATLTPSIGVWTHHHPIRFFDFADNVLHLVPSGHRRLAGGAAALRTFEERYRNLVYGNLGNALVEEVTKALEGDREPPKPRNDSLPGLNATGYTEQYYVEHVNGGLDYLGHGDWQRQYAGWLCDVFAWRGQQLLDVGCACGSILRGFGHVGAVVQGVDVSEFMVDRGRRKWPDQAKLMHVADCVNLHMFDDARWDALHCAQVAEHWRPELVPFILAELARVTKDGGLFFCTLDTVELFERNNRDMANEDKTHICVKPLAWWFPLLEAAGWELVSEAFLSLLSEHPENFLARYDWDFWVARRRPRMEVK